MRNELMIPHTATLYNRTGQDEDGNATYAVTILKNVYFRDSKGATTGKTPNDLAIVHIFDDSVSAVSVEGKTKRFVPEEEWKEAENRDGLWTLRSDAKDFIAKGDTRDLPPTHGGARRIGDVIRHHAGSRRMWRWEVRAR